MRRFSINQSIQFNSVAREIVGGIGDELKIGTESAKHVAPEILAAFDLEQFPSGLADQPGALRQLSLQLAFAPAGIANEGAHRPLLGVDAFLRFLQPEMMAACDSLRLGMPLKRGKNELIDRDRPPEEHGDSGERAKLLPGQDVGHAPACQPIHRQAKGTFFGIVRGEKEDRPAKIRVDQARMRNEQRAREAG